MSGLFKLPDKPTTNPKSSGSSVKLKKGQSINDLIEMAQKLVNEKLGNYKNLSKCVLDINVLRDFFNNVDELIAIDTETTGLNTFTDKLVGISLYEGKNALYIPINHISSTYHTLVPGQITREEIIQLFTEVCKVKKFKWLYHNAKFDLAVLRTFLGFNMPDPYWDTMLCGNLFAQDEDHGLKAMYNRYVSIEDEGVNRFDTLFKDVTFDYIPLDIATIYAGKDALMTYELYQYQKNIIDKPENSGLRSVMEDIEVPLLPIIVQMQRAGVNVNQTMLNDLNLKYSEKLDKAKNEVYKILEQYTTEIDSYRIKHYNKKLDDPISISSPTQLSILFYEILGYKTKSGKGTGVNELEEIGTPLTKALLEYRKMQKLIDAFLVALPKRIEPSTQKIHTSLNQYGAATR